MASVLSVFLSSTTKDLQEARDSATQALKRLEYHCVRMENFGARDREADEFCRAKVEECDLFVGLVGHLYGSSPPGRQQSYTEREYDAAQSKQRLMFLTTDNYLMPAHLREPDERWRKQQDFRQRVKSDRIVDFFTAPEQLASLLVTAVRNQEIRAAGRVRAPAIAPKGRAALTVLTPVREVLIEEEQFSFLGGGTFPMGSGDGYPAERPRRPVDVRPFFLGSFPVTNTLILQFVRENAYVTTAEIAGNGLCLRNGFWTPVDKADFRHPDGPRSTIVGRGNHPVVLVSWYDTGVFVKWFSEKTGFEARLPSESEWEYAASNGRGDRWSFGDVHLPGKANVQGNGTTTVGSFPPNELGLFDVTGNVYEWCANPLVRPAEADAEGGGDGSPLLEYPLRGGSWYDKPEHTRCSHKFSAHPALSASNWGFRVALSLSLPLLNALMHAPNWGLSLEEILLAAYR